MNPPFEGGLAKVFKAMRYDMPGKFYAVKIPLDPDNEQHVRQFHREVKVLKSVQHPNLIKCIDFQLDKNPPFIVLEYLAGGDLIPYIGETDIRSALVILYHISSALNAIHQTGGFHRDIKPGNILLDDEGKVVLSDLNIANIPSPKSDITRNKVGTDGYIDPFVNDNEYDEKADIWSLGITVFELLVGKKPRLIPNQGCNIEPLKEKINKLTLKQQNSIIKLFRSVLEQKRQYRPTAALIQQYTAALLEGAVLPKLPVKPDKLVKPQTQPTQAAEALLLGALGALIFVGIAALLTKE